VKSEKQLIEEILLKQEQGHELTEREVRMLAYSPLTEPPHAVPSRQWRGAAPQSEKSSWPLTLHTRCMSQGEYASHLSVEADRNGVAPGKRAS
jgi:hypothetical protein